MWFPVKQCTDPSDAFWCCICEYYFEKFGRLPSDEESRGWLLPAFHIHFAAPIVDINRENCGICEKDALTPKVRSIGLNGTGLCSLWYAQSVDMQRSPRSKQLDRLKFCVVVFHW